MGMFLRGQMWYYEIRTSSMRIVKSTGFKKEEKERASEAYQTALTIAKVKPPRSVAEKLLAAVYEREDKQRLAVGQIWTVYEKWFERKKKRVDPDTWRRRRNRFNAFCVWCAERGVKFAEDITVDVASEYIATMSEKSNKTQRIHAMELSGIWSGVAQMMPGIHNPWKAACPADDGSAERRDVFSPADQQRILEAAKKIGHDWYGVCMVGKWTGQRYGDCATLEWGRLEEAKKKKVLERGVVDLDAGIIVLDPSKTRRHGTRLFLPIAAPLAEYLVSIRKDKGCLFHQHAAYYAVDNTMDPSFSAVLQRAGVTGGYYDFHSWRHTFRSQLGEASVSDETANRFGGWTAPKMGAHYDHSAHLAEMREALARIK